MVDQNKILNAAAGLIDLLDEKKEVETRSITITVDLPVAVLDLCSSICKEMGLTGMEKQIISGMVQQGLLENIRTMGGTINTPPQKNETPPANTPQVDQQIEDFINSGPFAGLQNIMDGLDSLGDRLNKLQGFLDGKDDKNNQ